MFVDKRKKPHQLIFASDAHRITQADLHVSNIRRTKTIDSFDSIDFSLLRDENMLPVAFHNHIMNESSKSALFLIFYGKNLARSGISFRPHLRIITQLEVTAHSIFQNDSRVILFRLQVQDIVFPLVPFFRHRYFLLLFN